MTEEVYVEFDREWLEENAEDVGDGERAVVRTEDFSMEELFVKDGKVEIGASVGDNNMYVAVDIPMESKYVSKIVEHAIKKLNKFKTVWEGLK